MLGALWLPASAQDSGKDTQAQIKQIEDLQWQVTWADYLYADVYYYVINNSLPEYYAYVTNYDTNERTNLLFDKNVTAPASSNCISVSLEGLNLPDGKYELVIPEGYVYLIPGGSMPWEDNVTQYFDIQVGDKVEVDHSPIISQIMDNYFNITWENVTAVKPNVTKGATLTNLDTDEVFDLEYLHDDMWSKANIMPMNNNGLRVNLSNNNLKLSDGRYRFYLPADYVKFNGTTQGNEAIYHDFLFNVPWSEGEVMFEGPFDDGTIKITYVDADRLELNPDYVSEDTFGGSYGIFLYDSTSTLFNIPYPQNVSIEGNVITVSLNGLGISNGECQMEVPYDYLIVYIGDKSGPNVSINSVYRFNYTNPDIDPEPDKPEIGLYPEDAVWNVRSGDTVKSDSLVEISWPGTTIEYAATEGASIGIHNPGAGYIYLNMDENVWISEDETKLVIDLSTCPSGVFRLTIDEAYVYINKSGTNYYNVSTWVDNLIIDNSNSGLTNVQTDGCDDAIYNLNGVKLNATDLNELPKGVYIIGGKKVIK